MEALGSPCVVFWLAVAASTSGMAGTALVFFFGVPRQTDTGGRGYLVLEQEDEGEKARIRHFKRLGNLGLALIFVSFLLQLVTLLLG